MWFIFLTDLIQTQTNKLMKPIIPRVWQDTSFSKTNLSIFTWLFIISLLLGTTTINSQVNTGGNATTSNHNKQIIGYITNWDAWKSASAGVPTAGALTHLNIDYSKYTILNFSFFGVAVDGSLHSGDYRNKQIYQPGAVQQPNDLIHKILTDSWDWHILFGETESIQYISEAVKQRAEAQGFQVEVNGSTWTHPGLGLSGNLPLPLHKEGGAPGLLELAHQQGVKVMASIGGWSMCKHFPEMAADPVKRAKFIADCKRLIDIGFDGIDLDWEYPGPFPGMNFAGTDADFGNFATLVQEIRNAIGPSKLITAAMAADPKKLDGFNWSQLAGTMDYFNMMTYDFNGGWSNIAGHNAPVYPYDGAEAPDFNWQSTLSKLISLGVPSNKINFGAPFYGRGVITDGNAALNAPTVKRNVTIQPDGPVSTCADYTNWTAYDGTPNHFFVKQKTGPGSGWTRQWDDQAKVPYMTNGNYFLSYDDEESIGIKAQFINDNNLAGTIVWTVYGDLELSGSYQSFGTKLKRWSNVKSPLINKMNEVFAGGGNPNPPGNQNPSVTITSPQAGATFEAGANITISANADDTDGTIARVEFYDGGTLLGQKTTSPYTYTWNNVAAGTYTIAVKAIDNDGGSGTASVSVTVNGGGTPPGNGSCSAPTWESGQSYTGGQVVSYEGHEYKARWWTQQNPVGSTEWEDLGPCDGTGNPPGNGSCTAPAWQSGQSYTGGQEVSFDGREYRARWWTQQNPVGSSEWEDLGACSGGGNGVPQVAITAPTNGQSFVQGNVVAITADASDTDGTISNVEFYVDGSMIGQDNTAPYTTNWTATIGSHNITAKATDNANQSTTSTAVSINVTSDTGGCDSSGFKVVGYMPSWQGTAGGIQYDKLTHINYSFLLPNSDGSLRPLDNISKMQQIVTQGHAQGVKILIAVGGWMDGNDSAFTTLAANPSTRTAFVNNLVNFVNQYNLDGVDMDWEYPREGNEPQNYELLMQELGQAMHSRGKLLTAAVVVSGWNADGVLTGVFDDVDFLNIMAYDGPEHGSMSQATGGLDYWLGRGLPKSKAVLGVPFYSRPQVKSYSELLAMGADPNSDSYQGMNYNGVPTIKAKTEMALQRGGGIMMWELSHDTNSATTSLLAAINQVVGDPCGNPPVDNQLPTVAISSPANNASYTVGQSVSISANANDPDGSVSKVTFYVDGNMISEDTSSPYTANWTATTGNHSLTAMATDNEAASTTSSAITIMVQSDTGGGTCDDPQYVENNGYQPGSKVQNEGNVYQCRDYPNSGWCNGAAWAYAPGTGTYWEDAWTLVGECGGTNPPGNVAPTVSITNPTNGQSFAAGSTITINANASDTDGNVTKVEFFSNGTKLGEDTTSPYSYSWSSVSTGNYTLTAKATDNANATGDATAVNISVGSTTPPPGGDLPKRLLVGYWHNFDNGSSIPKLRDVSDKWDVINVSFAIPTVLGGSTMTFTPDPAIYGSTQEFKNDVALLQSRGKKVLISMGGATGAVDISSPADAQAFSSSMISIINEYGFNGMDIDFEGSSVSLAGGDTDFKNPTSPKIVNLINACRTILSQFGSDFILSMAPETLFVQGGFSSYGGPAGAYLPIIYALRNDMDYIHVQHYNTGCMLGLDGLCYSQGTADFQVAMADMLLQGFAVAGGQQFPALRQDQVAIGLPASPSAAGGGYTAAAEVHKALDYIIKGQSFGGSYTLRNPSGYANFRGLMTWSINWDIVAGFGFSNPHRAYLDGLDSAARLVQSNESAITLSPNPVNGDVVNFTVATDLQNATYDLQVFNSSGIQVLDFRNTKIQKGKNLNTFDVSKLEEGLYFYTIITPKGKTTGKLIKR